MANRLDTVRNMMKYSLIQGSPESTYGKVMHDGSVESYGNFAQRSRKEINHHITNGTDINALLHALLSGVVGSKINIQSVSKFANINTAFEDLISEHGEVGNFDVTKRFSSNKAWEKILGFKFTAGGILLRHHYSTAWDIPYKMELIGVDMIDINKNIYLGDVQNGLKKDKYGAIVGIYIYIDDKKTQSKLYSMKDMTYFSDVWMSLSQYTAVSRVVSILQTLDATKMYSEAEVKAAMERAKSGVYWHTELYATILEALNEELKNDSENNAELIMEAKDFMDTLAVKGVGHSGATPIPMNDTITQIDNKTDTVYKSITDQSEKSIASAMGGSSVSVYKDISKGNYASIKAAIAFDEEGYKMEFRDLKDVVILTYLKNLFRVGVQIGRIPLATSKFVNNPRKYMKFDVLRTSRRIIDEQKDATSTAKRLETNQTTLTKTYARDGLDYLEQMENQIDADILVEQMRIAKYEVAKLPLPKLLNGEEVEDSNVEDTANRMEEIEEKVGM